MLSLLSFLIQDPEKAPITYEPLQGRDVYGQVPPAASTFTDDVDGLFEFCWIISVIFFVLIAALLVWSAIMHRRKSPDQPALSNVTHNTTLEVVWTLIPTVILMVIFAWGWKGNIKQSIAPGDAIQYRATAKKWLWQFYHPGAKNFTVNELWVPLDRACKITTHSEDVLHSLYVPAFRAKRDVLPGRYQALWFKPTATGTYPLFCTEYCGDQHSRMIAWVHVVTQEVFDTKPWEEDLPTEPVALGKWVHERLCISCHSVNGNKGVGPSWKGIWGREEEMTDGSRVIVDAEYITESIRNPAKRIVKGYPNGMVPYPEDQLPEDQLNGIIEYMKTLKD